MSRERWNEPARYYLLGPKNIIVRRPYEPLHPVSESSPLWSFDFASIEQKIMDSYVNKPFTVPDLRALPLEDIIHALRGMPWSSWMFQQLDETYRAHLLKAQTEKDYIGLRDHISFMLTYFLPQHLIEVSSRNIHEARWAVLAQLADTRVKEFRAAPVSGSPEFDILKLLASRESSEFNLLEPLTEDQKGLVDGLVTKGLLSRVALDRPLPLRPQDYTLVLTNAGRNALQRP